MERDEAGEGLKGARTGTCHGCGLDWNLCPVSALLLSRFHKEYRWPEAMKR